MKLTEFTVYTSVAGTELLAGCFIAVGLDEYIVYEGKERAEEFLEGCAENWDYADIDNIAPDSEPYIRTYIPHVQENEGLENELCKLLMDFAQQNKDMDLGSMRIETNIIDEEDWANNWKQYYKPMPIGSRLMICPSWEEVPELGDRKLLLLDPGMAFGSGLHETTSLCLETLEKTVHDGMSLIDLGCGSGILSIAGSLLGAKRLMAVDVDPVCTQVTQDNAAINNVSINTVVGNVVNDDEFIEKLLTNSDGNTEQYDVVVANIVAGILIKIAHRIPQLMKKGGTFISSGIINERADEVAAVYAENGIKVLEILSRGEWSAIVATIE